jgi:pimeloyl-ACP methyl ester carboxylesterase
MSAAPPTPMIFPRTLVRAGFEPLPYHSVGNGRQTIAICNAHGQSLGFWEPLVRNLRHRFHVLVWQPRGTRSPSGGMTAVHPVQVHVEDMRALLRIERVTRAHLLGWSTAPKIALEFEAAHPRSVASLIFVAGCFVPARAVEAWQTRYERALAAVCRLLMERPQAMRELVATLRQELIGSPLAGPGAAGGGRCTGGPVSEPLRTLLSQPTADFDSLRHYAAQLLAFREHRIDALLPRVAAPTLLVCGEHDSITSPRATHAAGALIPGATVVEIPGASHYVHHESAVRLAELIGNFVRRSSHRSKEASAAV